jgi:hypothetical protein
MINNISMSTNPETIEDNASSEDPIDTSPVAKTPPPMIYHHPILSNSTPKTNNK